MKNKISFFSTLLITSLLFSCNQNTPNLPTEKNSANLSFRNNQGPNSTGALFRLTDKFGSVLKNTGFSVLSQNEDKTSELLSSNTDSDGQAYVSADIFDSETIKNLRDNKIRLIIKITKDDKESLATIKEVNFKSERFVEILAQNEAPNALEVKLSQKSVNISVGKTTDVSAEVSMSDGTKNNAVTWSSSDETIATVRNGKISGLSKGAVVITVRSAFDFNVYSRISLTVSDDSVITQVKVFNSLDRNPVKSPLKLTLGELIKLDGQVLLSDGSTSTNVIWKSSDESVASVGRNTGIITGVSSGRATISCYASEDISKLFTFSLQVEK